MKENIRNGKKWNKKKGPFIFSTYIFRFQTYNITKDKIRLIVL